MPRTTSKSPSRPGPRVGRLPLRNRTTTLQRKIVSFFAPPPRDLFETARKISEGDDVRKIISNGNHEQRDVGRWLRGSQRIRLQRPLGSRFPALFVVLMIALHSFAQSPSIPAPVPRAATPGTTLVLLPPCRRTNAATDATTSLPAGVRHIDIKATPGVKHAF
jgi:hypothetical protein